MSSFVIAGYGVELTPRLPINVAHLDDGTLLFGTTMAEAVRTGRAPAVAVKAGTPPQGSLERRAGDPLVTYSCGTAGATEISLGHGVDDHADFFDASVVAERPACWTIVAADHEIQWPPSFTLSSDGTRRQRSSYQLAYTTKDGAKDQLVSIHGPFADAELPPPPALVGPGMKLVADGGVPDTYIIWFELWYEHHSVPWKQIVYYVPFGSETTFMLRAQVTTANADAMFAATDVIAQTLRAF